MIISIVDALALMAPLALTTAFVAAFFDDADARWAVQSFGARSRAMPALGSILAVLWLMALLGLTEWPGALVRWVAAWSFEAVAPIVGWLGASAAAVMLGLVIFRGIGARGGGLRGHVIASQGHYAALLLGIGAAQAGLGSH